MTRHFPLIVLFLSWMATAVAAETRAECKIKGSFEGKDVSGATAEGQASPTSRWSIDLFAPRPTHDLIVSLTPVDDQIYLTVSLGGRDLESDLFLETRLSATVLSFTMASSYNGQPVDTLSLICLPAA